MSAYSFSEETLRTLRNCKVLDIGTYKGKNFVRYLPCPPLGYDSSFTGDHKRAIAYRVVNEINDPGVVASFHVDYGGIYVPVETDTIIYRLIRCLKSRSPL